MITKLYSISYAVALTVLGFVVLPAEASIPLKPVELRCEYLTNPIGIDVVQPRLSWVLTLKQSTGLGRLFTSREETRGKEQTAYRAGGNKLRSDAAGL